MLTLVNIEDGQIRFNCRMRSCLCLTVLACALLLVHGQDSVTNIIDTINSVGVPAAESLLDKSGSITADLAAKCAEIEAKTGVDVCTRSLNRECLEECLGSDTHCHHRQGQIHSAAAPNCIAAADCTNPISRAAISHSPGPCPYNLALCARAGALAMCVCYLYLQ